MAFEDVEKIMEKMKHIRMEFGEERMKAVPIFESIPCYDEEKVLELTRLSRHIQQGCTDAERPALIKEFAKLRDTISEKDLILKF